MATVTTTHAIEGGAGWEFLRRTRGIVDGRLRTAVNRLGEPMRTVAGYHFGWCDARGVPTDSASGKAIRPALVLLCAQAVGTRTESGVDAAVAVELVHNFTLLHDDVMDGDATRRHRPTVWSVFGMPAAIQAGDALLALAVEILVTQPAPRTTTAMRWLCDALLDMVSGQCADISFEHNENVELDECVTMAADKTAALIGCACALGALLGGAEAARVERLHRFGHHLGLAFQLIDDLLGIWGNPRITGKPVWSDLRAAKKSLPVVAALTSGSTAGHQLAALYHRRAPLGEDELATAASLIEQAGGRRWAEDAADRHLRTALTHLDAAGPSPNAATQLTALAHLITRRDR